MVLLILSSNNTATYTLTNAAGCDSIVTLDLTINTSPTVDLGTDTILCNGTSIDLDAGSGFTYLWNDATTNQTLTASATGDYIVTITDGNGCTDSDTINVTLADSLVLALDSTNITCNGLTDGTAIATVTGGTPNYSYLWNDVMHKLLQLLLIYQLELIQFLLQMIIIVVLQEVFL